MYNHFQLFYMFVLFPEPVSRSLQIFGKSVYPI